MVSIFACGASTILSAPGAWGFTFLDARGNTVSAKKPLLLFPEYLDSQDFDPGSIKTGSPNEFGEKSCVHHNVKGIVFESGSISLDKPWSLYGYQCKSCVSQRYDSYSGKLREFPYSTLATLSSVVDERDATVYTCKADWGQRFRRFDQRILWKRYRDRVYASVYTSKGEVYNPNTGWVSSTTWNCVVSLYDYRLFPDKVFVTSKSLTGEKYATMPSFDAACKAADSGWYEWTTALDDGLIIRYVNLPVTSTHFTQTRLKLEFLCSDPDFKLRFGKKPAVEWGDLCEEAINDCHVLDANSIALTRDLLCLVPELKVLSRLLKSLTTVKRFASLYLSTRYGIPLTVKDVKETMRRVHDLKQKAENLPVSIVRSQSNTSIRPCGGILGSASTRQWYKIYYRPIDQRVMNIFRSLLDWDIYPTFQNLWDLVPFSFVLDWFVDVESLMNKMDANVYIPYLDVLAVTRTRKDSCNVSARSIGVSGSGDLTLVLYEREVRSSLDVPRLKINAPKKFHNWAELTAIIIQKKGR